jgi:hypothetical protein
MLKFVRSALIVVVTIAAAAALVQAQPAAQKTAGAAFLEYRAVFEKAKAVDEILPFQSKDVRAQILKTPAAERKQMFEMMKAFSDARGIKVIKEAKNAAGVELAVEGKAGDGKVAKGTIQMVQEEGAWKIAKEDWK